MTVSNTVWWILAGTVIAAIIILVVTLVVWRKKYNRVRREYNENSIKAMEAVNEALNRENPGELLWEEKNKAENPIGDFEAEFLINTALRNKYKTFKVINGSSYEEKTLVKLGKMKKKDLKPDMVVILNAGSLNADFDEEYKMLTEKKMLLIVNAPRKEKNVKGLISYLKTIGAKYEWTNIGKGIIVVVR